MPNLAVDPVVIAAHVITALQLIASRNIRPLDALVVSVCSLQTSQVGAFNVIPDAVTLLGTVRTLDSATRELAEVRIREIACGVAASLGGRAEVELIRGTPVTINSAREAALAAAVGERVFGAPNIVRELEPNMGGEDFAYMLQVLSGALVLIGQGGTNTRVTCIPPVTISTTRSSRSVPATSQLWPSRRSPRTDRRDIGGESHVCGVQVRVGLEQLLRRFRRRVPRETAALRDLVRAVCQTSSVSTCYFVEAAGIEPSSGERV